jgi:hypothetical protein
MNLTVFNENCMDITLFTIAYTKPHSLHAFQPNFQDPFEYSRPIYTHVFEVKNFPLVCPLKRFTQNCTFPPPDKV